MNWFLFLNGSHTPKNWNRINIMHEDQILIIQGHLYHIRDLQQALPQTPRFVQESRSIMCILVFLNSFLTQKLWCSANTFLYLGVCDLFKWQVLYICFVLKEIFANSEVEWWLCRVTSLIMSGFGKKSAYWNGQGDFHWGPNGLCASSPLGTSRGWSSFHLNHPKLLTSN